MKNVMKKIGWTVVSLLPVLAFFAIQFCCAGVVIAVIAVTVMLDGGAGLSTEAVEAIVMSRYKDSVVLILIVSQLAAVLVFGLWYYFAWGKKKRPEGTEKPEAYHILLILLLGVAAQFAISGILSLVEIYMPGALEEYEELMEMAGLTEVSSLTLVATAILAPFKRGTGVPGSNLSAGRKDQS